MRRITFAALAASLLLIGWMDSPLRTRAQTTLPHPSDQHKDKDKDDDPPEKKLPDFDKTVKGAKEFDGLFKLYRKDEHVFAEIKPNQLDRPLLAPIAIARGSGLGGFTLNFEEQWVLVLKKVSDTKLHLIRRNVHFKAAHGSPVAKAVETTYTDSVLMTIPIRSIHPGKQSVLIDLNDIFMTDFAELGLGRFDPGRSTWHKIKAFPKNIELQVQATFSGGRFFFGDQSNIDPRGTTVVIHYGLVELPDSGYTPRMADDRVGYFLSVTKDFSSDNKDTSFLRYVNRWRLERADTDPKNKNKLSVPKKKIVFWIENSVPFEYRAFVREGILEWNKAFEKIGFRDAIEVRQQENEEFDPEDMNYNTFRWITTGYGFAMGPSRANPFTGELLDADIIFDADMVRFWKQEAKLLTSGTASFEEQPSPIMAIRQGHGLMPPPGKRGGALNWDKREEGGHDHQLPNDPRLRLWAIQNGVCQCQARMKYELGLAAMTLAARGQIKGPDGIPEELIGQAIKSVVMHEVGHTLGLRHNFKASTMLKNEQLHDKAITSKMGLSGSVMDYLPVNIAPKGTKQGDYFTTTIGPYDYWAIEYAYKPLEGGTEGEFEKLQEIAKKGALPGHDFGTDEDLFGSSDPHINAFDLGADPMKYAMDRMQLAEELMKTLSDKAVDKGEGYQRTRQAFMILLYEYANGAFLLSQFVGGEHIHRDHRGDPKGRDPFVPVKADRQRKALAFLQEHLLSERYFKFSPQLLRRLAADRWLHWGNEGTFYSVDMPINQYVLAIQRIALRQLLNPATLTRIQDNALKVDGGEKALSQAEVFRSLTEGIWGEYPVKGVAEGKSPGESSVMRRNLQRQHLKDLADLVVGKASSGFFFGPRMPTPPDARSLARHHLKEIQQRIELALKDKGMANDDLITTRAHLEECRERIGRVLSASLQVND
jgi:hypothetical protein